MVVCREVQKAFRNTQDGVPKRVFCIMVRRHIVHFYAQWAHYLVIGIYIANWAGEFIGISLEKVHHGIEWILISIDYKLA